MDNFKFPASLNPDTSHLYANTQLFISSTTVLTAILSAPEINQAKHTAAILIQEDSPHYHMNTSASATGVCNLW
jgi:hypothetical protein